MWDTDDQLVIEQQKTGDGIKSTVKGWMSGDVPGGTDKYTKDGKRIVWEEEWFFEDGKWVHVWIYEDQVYEVEDAKSRLAFEAAARERKKSTQIIEETVVEEKEVEEEIKGPGMRIIIRGPFRLQRAPPKPGIKWKKKVEEVVGRDPMVWDAVVAGALRLGTEKDLGEYSSVVFEPEVLDALAGDSDSESSVPVVLEQAQAGSSEDVGDESVVPSVPVEDSVVLEPKVVDALESDSDSASAVPVVLEQAQAGSFEDESMVQSVPVEDLVLLEPEVVDALAGDRNSEAAVPVVLEQAQAGSFDDDSMVPSVPVEDSLEQAQSGSCDHVDDESMVPIVPVEDSVRVQEGIGKVPAWQEGIRSNGHGDGQGELEEVRKELKVIEALEESDSGVETTPEHEIKKLKQILYGIGREEKQLGVAEISSAVNYTSPQYINVTQQLCQPKETLSKSQDPTFHKAVASSTFTQEEKVTDDIESFEYEKVAYSYVDVTKNRTEESITRSLDPNYNNGVENEVKITLGELQGVIPGLVYIKPCYELLKREQSEAFVSQVTSEAPQFLEAGEGETKVRAIGKANVSDIPPIKWHKCAVAKADQELSLAHSSVVKTDRSYHTGKQEETVVQAEEVKENIEKLTYSKAAVEQLAKQRSIKPEVFQQTSQNPQFNEAKETKRELKLKSTLEEIPAEEYQKLQVTKIPKVPFNMVVKSSVDVCVPIFQGEEGKIEIEFDEVDGEFEAVDYKKPQPETIKQVVWKHNTDEISSCDANYLSGEEKKLTLKEEELGAEIEPYEMEACAFSTVSQEMYLPNSEQVQAAAPKYHDATENEVVVTAEQTRKGSPPIPWEKAAVEIVAEELVSANSEQTEAVEATYLHAEDAEEHVTAEEVDTFEEEYTIQEAQYEVLEDLEGKVENVALQKAEAPRYDEGTENSLELELSEIDGEMAAVEYESLAASKIPEEATPEVKSEMNAGELNLITLEEQEESLQLERVVRLQPPIIDRAEVDIIENDRAMPVYVNQQQAVQVPLPIHKAVEGDLPEWEQCEDVDFEEHKTATATPKLALGQLYKADTRQPQVKIGEQPSPVISDEVHQQRRPINPPPRANFQLKEKLLELMLEETEELPPIVKKSAKLSLVPKEKEDKADIYKPPTLFMDIKFADENQNYLQLDELGDLETYAMDNADISLTDIVTFGKVEVAVQQMKKLDLPKLEFHEEDEEITVADLNLSPVVISPKAKQLHAEFHEEDDEITVADLNLSPVVISPKAKQLHAEFHPEEPENYTDFSLSLEAVPRSLLSEAHDDTVDINTENAYELPEIDYDDAKEQVVPKIETNLAEEATVDTFKAHRIHQGEEKEETVQPEELGQLEELKNSSLTSEEVAALDLWKALVEESKTELSTLQAEEKNINMVALEVISDISPLSPDIAKGFDLPGESYANVQEAPPKETFVYVPPPELKHSQEAVIYMKEQEVDIVPPSPTSEEKAKVLAVPTQRLENVQSSKVETLQALHSAEEHTIDTRQEYIYIIPPSDGQDAQSTTLPTLVLDRAQAQSSRIQQFPEEHSINLREEKIDTIPPDSETSTVSSSTLPQQQLDRARAERYRIQQLATEHIIEEKEQRVIVIESPKPETAGSSSLPHLEMDRARAERYRIEQLAQEGVEEVEEDRVDTIDPHSSDAARESTLPHLQMDRARAERYRIQQMAQEGSVDLKVLQVQWIDPHASDAARESTLPHLDMDRAHAERYRIQQLAQEGVEEMEEQQVDTIQPHTSDAARESTEPHLEMDRARAERYRIQQLAQEGSVDLKEQRVIWIDPHTSDAARESTLPHLELDRARAERYRIHQLAREDVMDVKEYHVHEIQPHAHDEARRSTLPDLEMERARAEQYRVQQLAYEETDSVSEDTVRPLQSPESTMARESSLPHLRLEQARADRYRTHQLGQEQVIHTRERYLERIPSSSPHRGRVIAVEGYPMHRVTRSRTSTHAGEIRMETPIEATRIYDDARYYVARKERLPRVIYQEVIAGPRPTTWTEIPPPRMQSPRETVVSDSVRNVIGVIPPLATDAARQGSIPAEVLQKVREHRVDSQQAPEERPIPGRVEITSVIPPLPADIAQEAETPAEIFRKVHSHHVHSRHMHTVQETNMNDLVVPQKPLPPLETRTSMWRLVPGHEVSKARSQSRESHYMPETETANGPIPAVERRVPSQHVVTSDEFHRADSSTLHSSWVPAEIQVVGELDTLMQQGIIRFNPLSQMVENNVDMHDYDEVFKVKEGSGIRRSSSLQHTRVPQPLQQTDSFKVGHIPRVGYPTKQWSSTQQLASENVEDRGDDDFDYEKLIKMTTGGKHEVSDDSLPKSGWSTIQVEGEGNLPEMQRKSMERITSRQESVFVEHKKPQPKVEKPPFAFDFSRLIHWTVGHQNEIEKLPTNPGANPPHLVPINFDKTTTWVVGTQPGSGTAQEKTYVSVAVPVRVRNTYFVEGSEDQSGIVQSPEATVLHDMKDWKTLTRQQGISLHSVLSDDPFGRPGSASSSQYSSSRPLQSSQGNYQPYNGTYVDNRQLKRQSSAGSSASGYVKRRAPQPPVQRTPSPVDNDYTIPQAFVPSSPKYTAPSPPIPERRDSPPILVHQSNKSRDSPTVIITRESPAIPTRQDSPPILVHQSNKRRDSPTVIITRDSPAIPAGRDSPPIPTRRDSPPVLITRDTPPITARRDSPTVIITRDSPAIAARRDSPPVLIRRDSPPIPARRDSPPPRNPTPPMESSPRRPSSVASSTPPDEDYIEPRTSSGVTYEAALAHASQSLQNGRISPPAPKPPTPSPPSEPEIPPPPIEPAPQPPSPTAGTVPKSIEASQPQPRAQVNGRYSPIELNHSDPQQRRDSESSSYMDFSRHPTVPPTQNGLPHPETDRASLHSTSTYDGSQKGGKKKRYFPFRRSSDKERTGKRPSILEDRAPVGQPEPRRRWPRF